MMMTNREYSTALRNRFYLNQPFAPAGKRCTCAGNPAIDEKGFHLLTCRHGGGNQKRHDALKGHLFRMLNHAGIGCTTEETNEWSRVGRDNRNLRPDISIAASQLYPRRTLLEITITHQLAGRNVTAQHSVQSKTKAIVQKKRWALTFDLLRKINKMSAK